MARRILIVATGLILTFEAGTYLHDYFTRYAERSQYAFANYGLTEALQRAVKWNPASIVVSSNDGAFRMWSSSGVLKAFLPRE
jgi:hypothetical protein